MAFFKFVNIQVFILLFIIIVIFETILQVNGSILNSRVENTNIHLVATNKIDKNDNIQVSDKIFIISVKIEYNGKTLIADVEKDIEKIISLAKGSDKIYNIEIVKVNGLEIKNGR